MRMGSESIAGGEGFIATRGVSVFMSGRNPAIAAAAGAGTAARSGATSWFVDAASNVRLTASWTQCRGEFGSGSGLVCVPGLAVCVRSQQE